ncbi:hypothetical protein KIW84_065915 [Lathyrus oleraceus]|uniref:non-specific serine/threonine protein kinase n=1 Tax=Pisum sativum TaxID=3888 RepID=A0A9D4WI48_PEA|nr:hypothetical protein KIW84_065915 [Pisum sativum]
MADNVESKVEVENNSKEEAIVAAEDGNNTKEEVVVVAEVEEVVSTITKDDTVKSSEDEPEADLNVAAAQEEEEKKNEYSFILLICIGFIRTTIYFFVRFIRTNSNVTPLGFIILSVDPYGGPPNQWQHNSHPPSDHVASMKPPQPPAPIPSRPPSHVAPPLPPLMSSSGGTGSNYSGGELLPPPSPGLAFSTAKSTFTYEELARATDGFSDANLLGQGGFGYVHRGILPNGKEVAVKQLEVDKENVNFKLNTGFQRLLVYEFVPNNTLEFHLHGNGRPTMDWPTRLRIALGSAKGLAYLHEDCHPKIIHRDIKAANILLDFKFEAKKAAIKKMDMKASKEFFAELKVLTRVHHLNLL